MISVKGCWKLELWISESRKKPTLCEECKVSAFFCFLKIHNLYKLESGNVDKKYL